MKKYIKIVIVSLVTVLILNIIFFSVITVVQAPYYEAAPYKVNSIYELYASEKYNDIRYTFADGIFRGGEKEIQEIENAFKSTSMTKLNKFDSYFKMLTLDKSDFVLLTRTSYHDLRERVMKTIIATSVLVYSQEDNVYVVCIELTESAFEKDYEEIAIYEIKNAELAKLLEEHKTPKNKGSQFVVPQWRYDISGFPESFMGKLYVLSFVVEFIVAMVVFNKVFANQQRINKQSQSKSKY